MKLRPRLIRWVLLAAGGGLLLLLVLRIGPFDIARALSNVGISAALLAVPYFVGTAISAFPWGLVLPEGKRPGIGGLVASRLAASGGNTLLFGLGGEPCRLLWLGASDRSLGLAAVVLDRLLYNAATAVFLVCGAIGVAKLATLPAFYPAIGAMTAVGVVVVSGSAAWAFISHGVGGRIHALVEKLRREVAGTGRFGADVDRSFRTLVLQPPARLVAATGVHLVARFVLTVEVYVALHVLGAPVDVSDALVLGSAQVALSAIASWIPSQIGVHEGGQAALCAALGIDPALGVAAVLLQRVRQLAFVGLTPLLIAGVMRIERRLPVRST